MKPNHPANSLYATVKDKIAGACGGCADVFGATEDVKRTDVQLVRQKQIPGTSGIIDLSWYLDQGYRVLTF